MKKLLTLLLILCLPLIVIGATLEGVKLSGVTIGEEAGVLTYLLRATWDSAGDQPYSHTQVVDTPGEGVEDGQLTVVELDGTLAVVSNEVAFTAQGTPTWGDLGLVSVTSFTKSLGMAMFGTINLSTWEEMGIGFDGTEAVDDPDTFAFGIQAVSTDGELKNERGTVITTGLSTSTDYKIVLVLGGYNTNGVAYKLGDAKPDFTFGYVPFIEISGIYERLFSKVADNTATLYAIFSSLDAIGTLDAVLIPDYDFSVVLQPTVLDSYNDANGVDIESHSMDVGSGWTTLTQLGGSDSALVDINSNRMRIVRTYDDTNRVYVYTESSLSDVTVEAILTTANGAESIPGVVTRLTDADNLWILQVGTFIDAITLYERDSGVFTKRGENAQTINQNTSYRVLLIANGQNITGILDGTDRVSYSFASFNEMATKHGIGHGNSANTTITYADNFAVHPGTLSGDPFGPGTGSMY